MIEIGVERERIPSLCITGEEITFGSDAEIIEQKPSVDFKLDFQTSESGPRFVGAIRFRNNEDSTDWFGFECGHTESYISMDDASAMLEDGGCCFADVLGLAAEQNPRAALQQFVTDEVLCFLNDACLRTALIEAVAGYVYITTDFEMAMACETEQCPAGTRWKFEFFIPLQKVNSFVRSKEE